MYIFRSPELDEKLGLAKVNTEEIKREVRWQSLWFKKLLLCSTVLSNNADEDIKTIVVDTTYGVSEHLSSVVGTICDKMLQAVYVLIDVFPTDPLISMQSDNMKQFKLRLDVEVNTIMTTVVPSYLQKASQMIKTCILDAWSELYMEYSSFQNYMAMEVFLDESMMSCDKDEFIRKFMTHLTIAKSKCVDFDSSYDYVLKSLNYAIMKRNRIVNRRVWVSMKLLPPELYADVCYHVFMMSGASKDTYASYIALLELNDCVVQCLTKTTAMEYLNIVKTILQSK